MSPKRFAPQLSDAWEQAIIRCLQRDPNARFSSALDVAKALSDQKPNSSDAPQVGVYARYGRLARIAFVLVLLVAIPGTVFYFRAFSGKGHATSVHAATRPTVAVLGFKNLSNKPDVAWISPALSQMLGTELTAGEKLRIIPSEQVAHGKIDLALADEDSLGLETLRRVRNNMGSDFVVLGSFLDMGGQIRIDLSLQDAVAGVTIATISESGPEQNLADLATHAGERLRHKLGVADPSADEAARTKASQSSSLEATRLYSEGLERLHSFDTLAARELLERAIAEDRDYALAHSALAEAWRSLGYGDKSAAEAKKAMDLSGSLSRESRLAIEAQYRNSIHEIRREAEIYKTLFNFYPDNFEYGYSLAKSQYSGAQYQEANSTLDALQQLPSPEGDDPRIDHVRSAVAYATGDYKKALALAERVELRAQQRGARRLAAQALDIQCTLQAKLGDPAKASAACDKSRTIYSNIGDYSGEAGVWGHIAFQAGDAKSGRIANERQIALLKKVESVGGLAWAMTVAGQLSADLGDYPRALREYNEALKLYQKIGEPHRIISAYANLGWVNSLQGNLTDAEKNDKAAIALSRQTNSKEEMDVWLDDLAEVLLDKGDVQGATSQMEEAFRINTETGDKRAAIYLHTARSRLLLAEGELNESRREAELAIKLCLEIGDEGGANERRLLLARLDITQNHSQSAAEALRKALSNSKTKKEDVSQIEARALLIEALLTMPSDESKREVALLAKVAPNTQNVSLKLAANLQIAQARFALGDRASALELLAEVISESKRFGYEARWLEARLARAEIDLQSGDSYAGRAQIERITEQAEAKGLQLIASKARSRTPSTASVSVPQSTHKAGSVVTKGPDITSLMIEKNGGLDPVDEGFALHSRGQYDSTGIRSTLNDGFDRLKLTSNDQVTYYRTLTAAEKEFAALHDWKLVCVCAIQVGGAWADIDFGKSGRRFDIELIQEGDKYFVGLTQQISPNFEFSQKIEFPGIADVNHPHTYELRYSHASQAASLWIDGQLMASGYRGHTQFVEDLGLMFGSGSYLTSKTGIGIFRSVRFEAH